MADQAPNRLPTTLVNQRMITWVDGVPTVTNKQIAQTPRNIVDEVGFTALLSPYKGDKIPTGDSSDTGAPYERFLDPEYEGMSNLEVAQLKAAEQAAAGDTQVLKMLLERTAGKPIEKKVSLQAEASLEDFLIGLTGTTNTNPQTDPIDAHAEIYNEPNVTELNLEDVEL